MEQPVELPEEYNIVVKVGLGDVQAFQTCSSVLLSQPETYFHGMLSGSFRPEDDGSYFIARDAEAFKYVLEFMTYGKLYSVIQDRRLLKKLWLDANFYGLQALQDQADKQLVALCGHEMVEDFCEIPIDVIQSEPALKVRYLYAHYKQTQDVPIRNIFMTVENFRLVLAHLSSQLRQDNSADIESIINEFSCHELIEFKEPLDREKLHDRLRDRVINETAFFRKLEAEINGNKRRLRKLQELEQKWMTDGNDAHLAVVQQEIVNLNDDTKFARAVLENAVNQKLQHALVLLDRTLDDFSFAFASLKRQLSVDDESW